MSSENVNAVESNEQTYHEQTSWESQLKDAIQEGNINLTLTATPTRSPDEEEIRCQRIQVRIEQLNKKLDDLTEKYMNDEDEKSIKNTILKHARLGHDKVYINLDRIDFSGWHTFVKGGYRNAHPRKCAHLFLRNAVRKGLLPKMLKWNIWNNQSFTVLFTIQNFNQTSTEPADGIPINSRYETEVKSELERSS